MEHLAERLARIPNVVAVTLGGSRATGSARPDSDWDFGLYYRRAIDPEDVLSLGFAGEVSRPGAWGPLVNGGAWLRVDGVRVDLCYRDLAVVQHWREEAEEGRFQVVREVGYVAGMATYVLVGELALGRVLVGSLPRPEFPEALRETAPAWWRRIAAGALRYAGTYAARDDAGACVANLGVCLLAEAQARLAARAEWALNEKGLVERAGLGDLGRVVGADTRGLTVRVAEAAETLALPPWGPPP
jgi:hypothetical protein